MFSCSIHSLFSEGWLFRALHVTADCCHDRLETLFPFLSSAKLECLKEQWVLQPADPAIMRNVRFLILGFCVLSACTHLVNRTCINLTIYAIVKDDQQSSTPSSQSTNGTSCEVSNSTSAPAITSDSSLRIDKLVDDDRQDWNTEVQGYIISAFFWTYLAAQLVSRPIASIIGFKWLISLTFVLTANISMITPYLIHLPVGFLIASRLMLGVCQGIAYPPLWAILTSWMPVRDRSFAFSCLSAGATLGSVIAFFASGMLIESFGWQVIFFSAGSLAIITSCLALTISDEPDQCKMITASECLLIIENRQVKADSSKSHPPYLKILTSPVILSTMLFKFSITWIQMIFYTKLPAYLREMTKLNFAANGAVNAAGQIAYLITLLTMAPVSEVIISSACVSRTKCRKIFSLVTASGQAILVALIPLAAYSINSVIATILLASFLSGFTSASDVSLASEQSNQHSVTLYIIYNISSMSCGMIAPNIISFIQTHFAPAVAWSIVFYSTAILLFISNAIFILFSSAENVSFDWCIATLATSVSSLSVAPLSPCLLLLLLTWSMITCQTPTVIVI